jgi:hypothetical protein
MICPVKGIRQFVPANHAPKFLTLTQIFQNVLLRLIGNPVNECSSGRMYLIPACIIISFALYSKYAMDS